VKKFDQQLLRLKTALGVVSDQEVAVMLGMTKAAFSDRKKRDSFPEDKLLALVTKRPDLVIDPEWVLHGKTAMERYTDRHKQPPANYTVLAEEVMRDARNIAEPGSELMKLSPREKALIENYRGSTEEGRRAVETAASALSHGCDSKKKDKKKSGK
jgi:hypothetical protein